MKTLVTGGAGFIGSNLVKTLVEEGHEVVVFDNLSSGYQSNLSPSLIVEFVKGDIRDAESLLKVMRGIEVVFHLAASVGNLRSIENPIEDAEVNVIGTLNVLNASREADVRRVVFSSSASIFGDVKHPPVQETHSVEPTSPYGVSKLAAEKMCLTYAKLYDLDSICLRYFNVYGLNQRHDLYGNVVPMFAYRLLRGLPLVIFGDGEQTRDFVNVRDVARANLLAAQATAKSGAFNIASGTAVTINRLVEVIREISGMDMRVEHAPPRQGDVKHSWADITIARASLGYQPTVDLQEGLTEYLSWMKPAVDRT